jgi:hypothetical protein
MPAAYTADQIAAAKRLLIDAPRSDPPLVPGAIDRIADAVRLKRSTVIAIAAGVRHANVQPAPADVVMGLIDWDAR